MYGIPYIGTFTKARGAAVTSYLTGYLGIGGSTGGSYMEGGTSGYYPEGGALIILENIDS